MALIWIHFGYRRQTWTQFEHHLDIFWIELGHILDILGILHSVAPVYSDWQTNLVLCNALDWFDEVGCNWMLEQVPTLKSIKIRPTMSHKEPSRFGLICAIFHIYVELLSL